MLVLKNTSQPFWVTLLGDFYVIIRKFTRLHNTLCVPPREFSFMVSAHDMEEMCALVRAESPCYCSFRVARGGCA